MANTNGEPTNGNGRNAGIQAYRWWISLGVASLCYAAYKIDKTVDATAQTVSEIQRTIATIQSTYDGRISDHGRRLDGIDKRNDAQDEKLGKLQEQFRSLPANRPPSFQPSVPPAESRRDPFEPYPPPRGR